MNLLLPAKLGDLPQVAGNNAQIQGVIPEAEASSGARAYVASLGDRVKSVTYLGGSGEGVSITFNNPETEYGRYDYVNHESKQLATTYKNPALRAAIEEAVGFGRKGGSDVEGNLVYTTASAEYVSDNVAKISYVFPNGQVLDRNGENFFKLILPEEVGFHSDYEITVDGRTYTGEIHKMEWYAYDEADATNLYVYGGWLK